MEHWYALHTKPRKERQVDAFLRGRGIETFLPTVRRKVQRRDRPARVIYFPCYLFANLDLELVPLSSIAWMPGVRRVVCHGDRPAVVPDQVVELLRERLKGIEEVGYGRLRQGDRVRIRSGPLRDLEAVFDQPLSPRERVRVLLNVLGRMTPVEIDYSQIEPL